MSVQIETELRGLTKARRVFDRLSYLDTRKLLDTVGEEIEGKITSRITEQKGPPEGGDWQEYTPRYKRWKERQGKLGGKDEGQGYLRLEGHLEESIQHIVSGDTLEVGSDRPYARRQHLMRPYVGLSDDDQDDIGDVIGVWLREVMGI